MAGTYTMRGATYEFTAPTSAEDISRLIWLANKGGDWGSQAVAVLKAARDAEKIIILPNGQRWHVVGRTPAGATVTTWVAERLPELVSEPVGDASVVAHLAAGHDLLLAEIAYLVDILDTQWHDLLGLGQVRANVWERETTKRLYIEQRANSTARRGENIGYIDLVTGAPIADDETALARAVAALLAGAQQDPDTAIVHEAADIARVQALVAAHRVELAAESKQLWNEVRSYSFRSKSVVKAGKAARAALLDWALTYATTPVETLTSPQVATLYKVARAWELEG